MVEIVAHFNIDEIDKEVRLFLEGVSREDIRRRANNVKSRIRQLIRERAIASGHGPASLADSVQIDVFQHDDNSWNAIIFSELDYAMWFEEGTGLQGPRHQWIIPKGRTKLFYFVPTGELQIVRAHATRGQEPHNVFRDGLEAAAP